MPRTPTGPETPLTNTPIALLTVSLALLAGACGSDADQASEGPTVSATTGILADITERVAGDDAGVEQVIPEGSSPHDFQLSAADRAAIEDSILLVHNGTGLEQGIPVERIETAQFALTEHAGELLSGDPHVWMDPTRIARALPALADTLAEADPEHAEGYRGRADEYAAELSALDRELAATLRAVPRRNRELVTSHDALGYFAARYGFEVVATTFPASGVEAETSAARIREVEDVVRQTGVPTVFAEHEDDPEVLELVAEDTGVQVSDELLVESPGSAGSYVAMLRHDAALIAAGLD